MPSPHPKKKKKSDRRFLFISVSVINEGGNVLTSFNWLSLLLSESKKNRTYIFFTFCWLLAHHRVNNHSYFFFIKCHLWVSISLSQSGSTNAFTFWHLFVGLLNASANHGRPLHDHVIGTSLVLLFSPSLTESNKAYSMANDLHWFSIVYQLVITFYRILLCGRRSQLSF